MVIQSWAVPSIVNHTKINNLRAKTRMLNSRLERVVSRNCSSIYKKMPSIHQVTSKKKRRTRSCSDWVVLPIKVKLRRPSQILLIKQGSPQNPLNTSTTKNTAAMTLQKSLQVPETQLAVSRSRKFKMIKTKKMQAAKTEFLLSRTATSWAATASQLKIIRLTTTFSSQMTQTAAISVATKKKTE